MHKMLSTCRCLSHPQKPAAFGVLSTFAVARAREADCIHAGPMPLLLRDRLNTAGAQRSTLAQLCYSLTRQGVRRSARLYGCV